MLRTAVVLLSCAALGAFAAPARGVTVSYSANFSTSKGNPVTHLTNRYYACWLIS